MVLINPHANGGTTATRWQEIKPYLEQHGQPIDYVLSHSLETLPDTLRDIHAQQPKQLLLVGGDGTLNRVVNAMFTLADDLPDILNIPLGVIPFGTGRDLARGLGWSAEWQDNFPALMRADITEMDVGRVDWAGGGCWFVNTSSTGITSQVLTWLEPRKNKSAMTYGVLALRALIHYTPAPVTITVDGATFYEGKIYVAVVANGTAFAGGMKIAPMAQLDDRQFEVFVLEDTSRWRFVRVLMDVYRGQHLRHAGVHHVSGQQITIARPSGTFDWDTDGESRHNPTLMFRFAEQRLRVLVPST